METTDDELKQLKAIMQAGSFSLMQWPTIARLVLKLIEEYAQNKQQLEHFVGYVEYINKTLAKEKGEEEVLNGLIHLMAKKKGEDSIGPFTIGRTVSVSGYYRSSGEPVWERIEDKPMEGTVEEKVEVEHKEIPPHHLWTGMLEVDSVSASESMKKIADQINDIAANINVDSDSMLGGKIKPKNPSEQMIRGKIRKKRS